MTKSVGIDSNYPKTHISRFDVRKNYRIYTDSKGVLCDDSGNGLGVYFRPNVFFTVPTTELTDRKYFSVGLINNMSSAPVDLYDVNDLTPNVAIKYASAATDQRLVVGYGNQNNVAVMLDKSYTGLNEDDEVVLKIKVAQAGTTKEYYSYDLDILNGYGQGDLLKIFGYDDEITKVEPITYNGSVLGPNNLPSIESTDPVPIVNFTGYTPCVMQVYKLIGDDNFIVQRGPIVSGNQRQEQHTCIVRNKEWQSGGILLYNKTEGSRAEVRQGTYNDLKSVVEYGNSKASIVVYSGHEGSGIQVIIYNL